MSIKGRRVAFLGAGNMGEALIKGLAQAGLVPAGAISASDPRLVKGVGWIKSNQRASGRWFTRSLHKDNKHFLTHAGSNMIYMGTRGMSALANMALGSVTTRVLHLCHIPVVLIH